MLRKLEQENRRGWVDVLYYTFICLLHETISAFSIAAESTNLSVTCSVILSSFKSGSWLVEILSSLVKFQLFQRKSRMHRNLPTPFRKNPNRNRRTTKVDNWNCSILNLLYEEKTQERLGNKDHSENLVRPCGLVVSAPAWDGTGREFDSWKCRIYIPYSLNLRLLGSLRGSLGTYDLTQKLC